MRLNSVVRYSITAVLILIVSPVVMAVLGLVDGLNWSLLSNIGQSFGGISAVLSAVALLAIARSNHLLQSQNQVNLDQAARGMQFRMLEVALNDPELQQTYSPDGPTPPISLRQRSFMTMRFRYLEYAFLYGAFTEVNLRVTLAQETFASPLARDYWSIVKSLWADQAVTDGSRAFVRIVNDVHASFDDDKP